MEVEERSWEVYEKDGIKYKVRSKGDFLVDYTLPVLKSGSIANINELKSLSLHNTGLEKIEPGAFQNLPNLKFLSIITGNLTEIEHGVFNTLDNLINLELCNCKISKIADNAFDNMTSLESIRLDDNKLSKWNSAWFSNVPSLQKIYVSGNLFEEIPANALGSPKDDIKYNIFLFKNQISKIDDDAFRGVKKIDTLQLGNNKIESFNGNFLCDIEIDELRISDNKIVYLEEKDFDKIFVARTTELIGNPWASECMEKIKKYAREHKKKVIF